METLILKQDQGILLAPDDRLGSGREPLEIRFSLIDFSHTNRNRQDIVSSVIEEPFIIGKILLTPGESIRLAIGEKVTPSNEPIKICFGEPDFTASGRSSQEQILASIVKCLSCAIPSAWKIEVVPFEKHRVEQIDQPFINIIAKSIEWKRSAKGRQYREHLIDVLLIGKLETNSTVWLLDQWAELFLDAGGPLEHACMRVAPLDIAEAGYSVEALTDTPSTYVGGLQLTFWEL